MQAAQNFPEQIQNEIQRIVARHGQNRHARRAVAALARKGHRLAERAPQLAETIEANKRTSKLTPGERIAMRRWIEEQS